MGTYGSQAPRASLQGLQALLQLPLVTHTLFSPAQGILVASHCSQTKIQTDSQRSCPICPHSLPALSPLCPYLLPSFPLTHSAPATWASLCSSDAPGTVPPQDLYAGSFSLP